MLVGCGLHSCDAEKRKALVQWAARLESILGWGDSFPRNAHCLDLVNRRPVNISIELPDEIAHQIGSRWNDIPRRVLEALVADACREGVISRPQAQEMLQLRSRLELDAFLKQARIYRDYTEEDLDADIQTLDDLLGE